MLTFNPYHREGCGVGGAALDAADVRLGFIGYGQVAAVKSHYGRMPITCDDYPQLLALMHHDKKNTGHDINFTLLGDVGDIRINQTASEDEIRDALDFYREC